MTPTNKLADALRKTYEAMEMQEKREVGEFHIPQSSAKAIWDEAKEAARKALAEHDASLAAPPAQGEWVMVPREPTEAMLCDFWRVCTGADWTGTVRLTKRQLARARKAYFAMLAVSPQPAPELFPGTHAALDALTIREQPAPAPVQVDDLDAEPGLPWQDISECQPSDDLYWFMRGDVIDGPRTPASDDSDYWSHFAPCKAPPFNHAAQPPAHGEAELPPLPKWDDVLKGRYLYTAMGHDRMMHVETYAKAYARAAIAALRQPVPDAVQTFTTGHCKNNAQPGGCQLHNLQCGYPACDRRPIAEQQETRT